MKQFELKQKENLFEELTSVLTLINGEVSETTLNNAWKDVKDDIEKRKMFYSVLFSIGDVTNREHNIFHHKKVDNGGSSRRDDFYLIMHWIFKTDPEQFEKFLFAGLFNEYTCFDNLFRHRVITHRRSNHVKSVYSTLGVNELYDNILVEYLTRIIRGNNVFNKMLVAKFLTLPRLSKRKGHKQMLPETKKLMEAKVNFLIKLSDALNWKYEVHGNICNFKGYRLWRKEYNSNLESVLFSTGKIFNLDEEEFIKWYDQLPALARQRVNTRVKLKPNTYNKLLCWIDKWENYKEEKQEEKRVLKEKERQGIITEEEAEQLKKVEKEAKVNVGATSLSALYNDIKFGIFDQLKIEAFIDRINLPCNALCIIDGSGSMYGKPFNFATFLTAVCMYKNPDDDARNLVGMFSNSTKWYTHINSKSIATSRFITKSQNISPRPFVDPKKSFYDNYLQIKSFLESKFMNGGTSINSIAESLYQLDNKSEVLDFIKSYPIWIIVTDGEWNNSYSPKESINQLFKICEEKFGFKPYIIAIDVEQGYSDNEEAMKRYSGIDHLVYINNDVNKIEQVLVNLEDSDLFNIYSPLLTTYRSNRYELVRNQVN